MIGPLLDVQAQVMGEAKKAFNPSLNRTEAVSASMRGTRGNAVCVESPILFGWVSSWGKQTTMAG